MSPEMKKSIDHGRPSDVHRTWVMGNFHGEKDLALDEKEGSALNDKGLERSQGKEMAQRAHQCATGKNKSWKKRSQTVQRMEIEKRIMQVIEGK
jgi:hypothetical protein